MNHSHKFKINTEFSGWVCTTVDFMPPSKTELTINRCFYYVSKLKFFFRWYHYRHYIEFGNHRLRDRQTDPPTQFFSSNLDEIQKWPVWAWNPLKSVDLRNILIPGMCFASRKLRNHLANWSIVMNSNNSREWMVSDKQWGPKDSQPISEDERIKMKELLFI